VLSVASNPFTPSQIWLVGVSRFVDNKHAIEDIVAGWMLGATFAVWAAWETFGLEFRQRCAAQLYGPLVNYVEALESEAQLDEPDVDALTEPSPMARFNSANSSALQSHAPRTQSRDPAPPSGLAALAPASLGVANGQEAQLPHIMGASPKQANMLICTPQYGAMM